MRRSGLLTLLTAVTLAACARPTPEQQIVNDAAEALGGRDRILAVKTLTIEGEGTLYNLGQDVSPRANGQTFTLRPYRRDVDIAGGRARTQLTRTTNWRYFQIPGRAPQPQAEGIDGAIAYNVPAGGTAAIRATDIVANESRLELLRHPRAGSLHPRHQPFRGQFAQGAVRRHAADAEALHQRRLARHHVARLPGAAGDVLPDPALDLLVRRPFVLCHGARAYPS